MSSIPFVSVMILCYNYGNMLGKALNACAEQTFRDYEIVMIDNGSTDNSKGVYQLFCKEHEEIKTTYVPVFPNEGPIHGWNTGVGAAKGEYIMFHDADDWMEPDCLERLAEEARRTQSDRVVGQYQETEANGNVKRIRAFLPDSPELPTTMLQGTLFRREVIVQNNLKIPEQPYVPAYDWWMVMHFACHERNKSTLVYGKPIYNYFINPISEVTKAQKKTNYKEDLKKWAFPVIDISAESKEITKKKNLQNQIEYLAMRHYYASIMSHFVTLSKADAKDYYQLLHRKMTEGLPGYLKNPYLRPFRNGYEQPGTMAFWCLGWAERLHMIPLVRTMARLLKGNKLLGIR